MFYKMFPRKGEIWAMYTYIINWRSSALSGYQCRVVEILSDFSEENGVSICSLAEVPGRLTFFQRQLLHDGLELTKQLSRFELLSFSHHCDWDKTSRHTEKIIAAWTCRTTAKICQLEGQPFTVHIRYICLFAVFSWSKYFRIWILQIDSLLLIFMTF